VIQWPWNWWVRKEQEDVLAHKYPQGKGQAEFALNFMGMIVWMALIPVIFAWIAQEPINLAETLSTFTSIVMTEPFQFAIKLVFILSVLWGFAVSSTFVLLKLKPPPS
jgi:hypothetical protein